MKIHLGFGLAGLGYLMGIGMLSCTPNLPLPAPLEVALVRVPLHAGLALCLLLSLSGGVWEQPPVMRLYVLVGLLAAACASAEVLYRLWFDPGCRVVEDLVAGLTGTTGLLVGHRLLWGQRKTART
jgi:hypothetical protein